MKYLRTAIFLFVATVSVAQTCKFSVSGTNMTLLNDCVVSAPITIPDGFTLNGNNHLISAPDSGSGLFKPGIITNGGAVANVKNLIIETIPKGICNSHATTNAIWFSSTSGSITGNTLLNTGDWNCVAGNSGITLLSPINVTVSGNRVYNTYGAALSVTCVGWPNCNGGGTVNITTNEFSTSNTCCDSMIYLSGVTGSFTHNTLNALVVYPTAIEMDNTLAGFKVTSNNINLANGAASQSGILVNSDGASITGNRIFNVGTNPSGAFGIYNRGASNPGSNNISGNEIRCYGTPVFQVTGKNVILTCPW